MKLTVKKIKQMYDYTSKLPPCKSGKLAYALQKNRLKMEPILEAMNKTLQEAIEPSEEFQKYNEQREKICLDHVQKTDKGRPVINNGQYVIKEEDQEAFNAAISELNKEYEEAIKVREEQGKKYAELLESINATEEDIEFHQVTLEEFDAAYDDYSPQLVENLFHLIKE